MQIIISIMLIGLLWMIYDLINAPEVDEDENVISDTPESEEQPENEEEASKKKKIKKITKIEN